MNIKITSDSTCDLSDELVAENDITILPLIVIMGDKSLKDGVDIVPQDIFDHVDSGGELCTTSALNVEEYRTFFEPLASEYEAVIHINIGSGISSCYQNACIAAKNFSNVYVIDSQNLSTGQGYVVVEACKLAKTCTDVEVMCEELREFTKRIEASFLLGKLEYMAKGGRCSSVVAFGASVMKLRLSIKVIDGKMIVGKKYRGTFSKCLEEYVKDCLYMRDDIVWDKAFLTHTPVALDDVKITKDAVAKYGHFKQIYETTAGCTISCHCGPGTLGILYAREK